MPVDYNIPNPLRERSAELSELPIEIVHQQHVEIEQNIEIEAQVNQEVQIDQTVTQQIEITETYTGTLIGYTDFNTDRYKKLTSDALSASHAKDAQDIHVNSLYQLIAKESFANIPRAIKYFSPAAAEHIAKHLPTYVSLDLDHLPQGFSCAMTTAGEIVLDYDEYAGEAQEEYDEPLSLYVLKHDVTANVVSLNDWLSKQANSEFIKNLAKYKQNFSDCLRFKFLYENYLCYLSNFTFIENGTFYQRIIGYDDQKYACLKMFLTNTGLSGHDINKTLNDFEFFWQELTALCQARNVDIANFYGNWQLPAGGHPAVYMRRLLFILRSARDLEEQFITLENLDLGQNGPYYAMREGLRVVSASMFLSYRAEEHASIPYNAHRKVYQVSWYDLLNNNGKLVKGYEFADLYRFVAQHENAISVNSLQKIFAEYCDKYITEGLEYTMFKPFVLLMFSVVHEGYINEKRVLDKSDEDLLSKFFIDYLRSATSDNKTVNIILNHLLELFNLDIKLDTKALSAVTYAISGLNSSEIETLKSSNPNIKKDLLEKLFTRLRADKYSALRFLYLFAEIANRKFPIDYCLDMADYLAGDSENVKSLYKQELLVLSLILANSNALFSKRTHDDIIPEDLDDIKTILKDSVSDDIPQAELMRYAIRHVILAGNFIQSKHFIDALNTIKNLDPSSPLSAVNEVLEKFGLYQKLTRSINVAVDMRDIRNSLLGFINAYGQNVLFEYIREQEKPGSYLSDNDCVRISLDPARFTIDDLGSVITKILEQATPQNRALYNLYLASYYANYRDMLVMQIFTHQSIQGSSHKLVAEKFKELHFIQIINDFNDLQGKLELMSRLSYSYKRMLESPYIVANQDKFLQVLELIKPTKISQEFLLNLFNLGLELNKIEYLPIFEALLTLEQDREDIVKLCEYIQQLANDGFPIPYITRFIKIFQQEALDLGAFQKLREYFVTNPADQVLAVLFTSEEYTLQQILKIISCLPTQDELLDRANLAAFINKSGCLDRILSIPDLNKAKKYLFILTKIYAQEASKDLLHTDYLELIEYLDNLTPNDLEDLQKLYTKSNVSFICLRDGLKNRQVNLPFATTLAEFEKNPFGTRPKFLHDHSQVERVVNNLQDRVNGSLYPYHYRKHIMEAFLFVDDCGSSLKVFANGSKSAQELSAEELKSEFLKLKENENKTFEEWLLGLALIREAMYRTTGKYAYSTQIIALIESMLHDGDTLTNIDTGQGKSLIDAMHASLLWLGSDNVTVTAPSHVDSGRDLAEFGDCFTLLGINHGSKPLSSTSEFTDFLRDGINFISFSHFGLLVNRARVAGIELLGDESSKVSLVINEEDDTILDDNVVCRLALIDPEAPSQSQFWIYDEINNFIDNFIDKLKPSRKATIAQDIELLKNELLNKAHEKRVNQKQIDYINDLSDDRLWMWMCSAKRVKDLNKNRDDYIILPDKEYKNIDGAMRLTNVVKLVMQDKQINLESQYGEGGMQLLYARLNKKSAYTGQYFVIPRESKTVLSSTNRVLIKEFQKRQGVVRGSSATTGTDAEVLYQHQDYGFGVTAVAPHQISKMVVHKPIFAQNNQKNQQNIKKILKKSPPQRPKLIFCANIQEVETLKGELSRDPSFSRKLQMFTGMPNAEQEVIKNAATTGMITITTYALGRNKNIRYVRSIGMDIIHTAIEGERVENQGSGRGDREGSPVDVYFCLDQKKYGGDKEAIRANIAEQNKIVRAKNQWIHDLLHYLLLACGEGKKNSTVFFHGKWSDFSKTHETKYREYLRGKPAAQISELRANFIEEIVADFNKEFGCNLDIKAVQAFMNFTYIERAKYFECNEDVKITDCMQPEILMLRLSDKAQEKATNLNKLFADSDPKTRHSFFTKAFEASRKAHWFQTPLTNLMQDKKALRLLRETTTVDADDAGSILASAKAGAKLLITEYLAANYFISSERKAKANELLTEIDSLASAQAIYNLIVATQLKLAENDIENNKNRLRSIHFFGRSRLQETLSMVILLVRTLDNNIKMPRCIDEKEGSSKHIAKFKYDSKLKDLMFTDKSNARVIQTSIQTEEVFEQENDRERKVFRSQ